MALIASTVSKSPLARLLKDVDLYVVKNVHRRRNPMNTLCDGHGTRTRFDDERFADQTGVCVNNPRDSCQKRIARRLDAE